MPKYLLFETKPTFVPEVPGKKAFDDKRLAHLADESVLKFDVNQKLTSEDLYSIPTPWARALLFQAALKEEDDPQQNHPAHEAVKNEWRGLLALMCFARHEDLLNGEKIIIESVQIEKNSKDLFNRVLLTLKEKIWPDDEIVLIKSISAFGEQLIGALSPYTLVFSPAQPYKIDVPWVDESTGRLTDPSPYLYNRDTNELLELKKWLQTVVLNIEKKRQEVDEYHRIYKESRLQHTTLEPWYLSWLSHGDGHEWIDLTLQRIKKFIDSFIEELDGSTKDIQGEMNKSLGEDIPNPYRDFLSPFDPKAKPVSNEVAVEIPIVMNEPIDRRIFSEKVLVLKSSFSGEEEYCKNSILGISDQRRRVILPFKHPNIYFDSATKEIKDGSNTDNKYGLQEAKVLIEEGRDWLIVRISYFDENSEARILTKTYNASDIISLNQDPLLEIWPDYYDDDWKLYYVIFADEKDIGHRQELQCSFVHDTYDELDTIDLAKDGRKKSKVFNSKVPPKHIGLFTSNGNSAGTIFINFNDKIPPYINKQWDGKAVIDFGTSNTMVMGGFGTNEFHPLKYNLEKPLQVFAYPDRDKVLLKHFFSDDPEFPKGGLPSVAELRKKLARTFDYSQTSSLLFRHVYVPFIKEFNRFSTHFSGVILQQEIKWSNEESGENIEAKAFIYIMFLYLISHAHRCKLDTLDLVWTYPLAYNEHIKVALSGFLGHLKTYFENTTKTKIGLSNKQNIGSILLLPESGAIANYMDLTAGENKVIFGVDIGGGTTDIAIYHERNFSGQCSLRIAGGHVVRKMVEEPAITNFILSWKDFEENQAMYQGLFSNNNTKSLFLTLLLKNKFDLFEQYVKEKYNSNPMRRFRTLSYYLIAGTAFYAGMLVNRYNEANSARIQYLGNGSNFIKLILPEELLNRVTNELKNMIDLGYSIISGKTLDEIEIMNPNSNEQKQEVSIGALRYISENSQFQFQDIDEEETEIILPGENGLSKEMKNAVDPLMSIELWANIQCPVELEIFNEFIEQLNKAKKRLLIEQLLGEAKDNILNRVKDAINEKHSIAKNILQSEINVRGDQIDKFENESPFIIALRTLVEKLPRL